MIRIGLDSIFPAPKWPLSKMHLITETIESNKFELILDEKFDSAQTIPINQGNNANIFLYFCFLDIITMNEEFEEEIKSDNET